MKLITTPSIAVFVVMVLIMGLSTYNLIQNIEQCNKARAEVDAMEKEMLKEGHLTLISYKVRGGLYSSC